MIRKEINVGYMKYNGYLDGVDEDGERLLVLYSGVMRALDSASSLTRDLTGGRLRGLAFLSESDEKAIKSENTNTRIWKALWNEMVRIIGVDNMTRYFADHLRPGPGEDYKDHCIRVSGEIEDMLSETDTADKLREYLR